VARYARGGIVRGKSERTTVTRLGERKVGAPRLSLPACPDLNSRAKTRNVRCCDCFLRVLRD
jgi:hypothetical protein